MRIAAFVFVLCSLAGALDNPVSHDRGITDCDVIKVNGEYYLTGNWLGGDMYCSDNLTDWGGRKHIFSYKNSWHVAKSSPPDMDIHGTHIAYENGKFHLYAHLEAAQGTLLGIVHAVSDSVDGPYKEPLDAPFDVDTIDSKTFRDEDGSLHWYSTRFGGVSGNHNDYRPMKAQGIFAEGEPKTLIWPEGGWEINPERREFLRSKPKINEGPFVFKRHGKYYMLYNANHTGDSSYEIGCCIADSPAGFSNAGKQSEPVLAKTKFRGESAVYEVYTLGQPWVVDGLNGFEKWCGYFAIDSAARREGRTQRIDRVHFLGEKLYIDGPTTADSRGWHPAPAEPQLRCLFGADSSELSPKDWTVRSGDWRVSSGEALSGAGEAIAIVNRDSAECYLFEANVRLDGSGEAGVILCRSDEELLQLVIGENGWRIVRKNDSESKQLAGGSFAIETNPQRYHKIRIERNCTAFAIWIDDCLLPDLPVLETDISAEALPGLYSSGQAAFDGVIYTIGWDEYGSQITGWADGAKLKATGNRTVSSGGITLDGESASCYKGPLSDSFEFSTFLKRAGSQQGGMGVSLAADKDNYLNLEIEPAKGRLTVSGRQGGKDISPRGAAITNGDGFAMRVVKLPESVIVFVDGVQELVMPVGLPAVQPGLITKKMNARFDHIQFYRTER
jgi:GH43 family beta-xylosidase